MAKIEDVLIEEEGIHIKEKIWYCVGLEYDPYHKPVIRIGGKLQFIGYLEGFGDNKIIFSLKRWKRFSSFTSWKY